MQRAPLPAGVWRASQFEKRQSALGVGQFWLATAWFAGRSCLLATMTTRPGCGCDASSRSAPSTIEAFTATRAAPFTAIAMPSAIKRILRFMENLPHQRLHIKGREHTPQRPCDETPDRANE